MIIYDWDILQDGPKLHNRCMAFSKAYCKKRKTLFEQFQKAKTKSKKKNLDKGSRIVNGIKASHSFAWMAALSIKGW